MTYKKRRKYKCHLHSEEQVESGIYLGVPFESPYLSLSEQGLLTIKKGYLWGGVSGPAIYTRNLILVSLVHDELYQFYERRIATSK